MNIFFMNYIEMFKTTVANIPGMDAPLWQYEVLGNTFKEYVAALVGILILILMFKVIQRALVARFKVFAQKTKTDVDDVLVHIVETFRPPFYSFLSFYLIVQFLSLPLPLSRALSFIITVWVVYYGVKIGDVLLKYFLSTLTKKQNDPGSKIALVNVGKIGTGLLWLFGFLTILSNIGVEITSLIAGLGVGGLAIAIALQSILSDLFASFAIRFDKPFTEGDFIVVGNSMGVVERIGIKTTRIRALQGEEIVVSNQELMSSRVQNFKKLQERRVVTQFGVEYGTPSEKLKEVNKSVERIVTHLTNARFDRTHFASFGESALIFEVVYYVISPDYNTYMDIQQEFNFALKDALAHLGVSIAFPTQTLHVSLQKLNA